MDIIRGEGGGIWGVWERIGPGVSWRGVILIGFSPLWGGGTTTGGGGAGCGVFARNESGVCDLGPGLAILPGDMGGGGGGMF